MLRMGRDMSNEEIATLLRMVAAAFEVKKEDFFRIKAYENAAASIEHATSSVKDLWEEGKLEDIPGVGPNLKQHLDELFRTGKVRHFEAMMNGLPKGMFVLMDLPGVGPKTAYKLAKEFSLNDPKNAVEELSNLVKEGRVRGLEGFGEQSEKELSKSIEQHKVSSQFEKRLLLPEAERLANEVKKYLSESKAVMEVEVLGSLRRKVATIGDVDLAVKTGDRKEVMEHLLKFEGIKKVLSTGEMTTMFVHKNGRQVDVKTQTPEAWGSMLQHYTGSKLHNISLRKLAISKHLSLSEHGIKKGKKMLTFETEEGFYKALGMQMVPPELREDAGEIQAALKNRLPSLVEVGDIKGDMHIHTNVEIATSHDMGVDGVEKILDQARELNYEYIGLSDHNPKSELSSAKKIEYIKRRREAIEKSLSSYEKRVKTKVPKIFIGLEVDIRPDGSLAIDEKCLDELDYAIGSMHSSFNLGNSEATKRAFDGLSHPKVKIFGHPTGRLLQKRDGLDYDWEKLFEFCAKNKKLIEVNATPDRLDLSDTLIRQAIKTGVKLVIDSDSHSATQLEFLYYGVFTARRGWAQRGDIANTLTYGEFKSILAS